MRYVKTIQIRTPSDFNGLQAGQWFVYTGRTSQAGRGQYMGTTRAGLDVLRMQSGKFGKASDTTRNKLQRGYAKQKGAK